MKMFIALASLIAVPTLACPNLTGTYTCTYNDGTKETLTVTQAVRSGITQYTVNGSTILADQQVYQLPDSEDLKQASQTAWCEGEILNVATAGNYFQQNQLIGELMMVIQVTLTGNTLKQALNGSLKNQEGEQEFSGETLCTK